jgi:hypothetical protein
MSSLRMVSSGRKILYAADIEPKAFLFTDKVIVQYLHSGLQHHVRQFEFSLCNLDNLLDEPSTDFVL